MAFYKGAAEATGQGNFIVCIVLSGCDAVSVSNAAYMDDQTKTGDNVSQEGQSWINSFMV